MSDEVRPSTIPVPVDAGGQSTESVDGPQSLDIEFPPPDDELAGDGVSVLGAPRVATPPPDPTSAVVPMTEAEPAVMVAEPAPEPAPQPVELPPVRRSERPPPPSQRASLGALHAESPFLPVEAGSDGPLLAAVSSLGGDGVLPSRAASEPVPLVVPRAAVASRVNSLPPGLVEPKRIIEVLGSNVPVLDAAWQDDSIEDLDESEAYELSETPVPEAAEPASQPELDVSVVVEDFPVDVSMDHASSDDRSSDGETPSANGTHPALDDRAGTGVDGDDPESSAGRRAKAPPNKRRRPPPPSARNHEKPKPPEPLLGARKWWEEMFSEEFLRAIPILSARQLEREVNFIDEGLRVARGGRILDLACGAGQHAVELASRGYELVGFDLSQSQLDWASGLAQERGQRLQFTYGDMRELAYHEAFDAVYSWNTSFGFFEEDKNMDVALRVFKALRPGGRFLLDVVNRDFVVAQQPGQTWFEGDGCVCIDDVSLDFITSRMKVKRTLMLTNGKNRECNYSLRIYGLHELGKILHDVGFKVLNVSGRPEMPGVFFGSTSPRIIILASKP